MKKITASIVLSVSFIFLFSISAFCKEPNPAVPFTINSTAFKANDTIPLKYVCKEISHGQNISIPLQWSGAPMGTKSYAIFMYDLNPISKNFVHWAVIDIPKNITSIPEGASSSLAMPKGSIELPNSNGRMDYAGPCPPTGTGNHQYKIIVYALNTNKLDFSGRTSLAQFQAAIDGKVIGEAEISVYFEQK